jgi:hypothetical protein
VRRNPRDLAAKAFPSAPEGTEAPRVEPSGASVEARLTRQAVDSWERGISLPSFAQLITFCDLFEWPKPLAKT